MNLTSWLRAKRRLSKFSLELGPEYANILALKGRSGFREIEVLRSVALPALDLLNGQESDRLTLAQELGDLVRLLDLQGRPVRMILPGDAVILRLLEVPRDLTPLELQTRVLEQESELYLPFSRTEADLDYFPLGPLEPAAQQVLLAAARRGYTDHCLQLATALGCELASLEPSCLALIRAFRPLLTNITLTDGVALLQLGIQTSELTLLREGVPLFERVLSHGVRTILATARPQITQLPQG